MLEAAGMSREGLARPAACYLMAYSGADPVGAVGVETVVDAALMRSLVVAEPMRRRGIGAALIAAVRNAAHTRGARRLFALAPDDNYLRRFGFVPVAVRELLDALGGALTADHLRAMPAELMRCSAFCLDISRDGVIAR